MNYTTELTNKILQSEEGKKLLSYVSPIYGDSYVALWIYQVIGMQLDKMQEWTDEFKKQLAPQTATWSLPMWEKEYGIVPELHWTVEQRRINVINRMKLKNPMNPYYFEQIISGLAGVPVEIEEHTGKNQFTVHVRAHTTEEKFKRANEGIMQYKPSHLIYALDIAEIREASINAYVAAPVSVFKKINVEVKQ